MLAYWTACLLDEHDHHPDETRRRDCGELVSFLTPVIKAILTELGHAGANEALGVLGGYGYIHAYGIEQQVRDSRAALIYEGTNEIQAIDFVLRKLTGEGRGLALLLHELRQGEELCTAAARSSKPGTQELLQRLGESLRSQGQRMSEAAAELAIARRSDPEAPYRVADDMLHAAGAALLLWAWARIATAASALPDSSWRDEKLELCEFGLDWLLPASQWRWDRIARWRTPLPRLGAPVVRR